MTWYGYHFYRLDNNKQPSKNIVYLGQILNHLLMFMVGIFNQKFYNDLFILAIVHSETQNGKTLLDAHFANANGHLLVFMKTHGKITRSLRLKVKRFCLGIVIPERSQK